MPLLPFSPDVAREACAELDSWHDKLGIRDQFGHAWTGQLRRDAEAEAVAASTRMEGVNVTVDEVRRILAGDKPPEVTPGNVELVKGYQDAMRFALARMDDPAFGWSRDLLIAIQDRAAAGRNDMGAGHLATGARALRDQVTGELVFTPPDYLEVPRLVDEMCDRLNASGFHPAVAAAWAHIATAAIHPFMDGNGRTARIVASLAMYRGGYRHWAFTTLESWWGNHTRDYYLAFSCLGKEFSSTSDVTPFIEMHVKAQLTQVRALDLRAKVERRVYEALSKLASDAGLEPRTVDAIWDAFWGRDVTAGYYKSLTEVSPAMATIDLGAATAAGLLKAVGEKRARKYLRGAQVVSQVAELLDIKLDTTAGDSLSSIVGTLGERETARRRVDIGQPIMSFRDAEVDYSYELILDGKKEGSARASMTPEAWARLNQLVAPDEEWHFCDPSMDTLAARRTRFEAITYCANQIRNRWVHGETKIELQIKSGDEAALGEIASRARNALALPS